MKKAHERFLLERFLIAASLTAEIVEEREAPDFLLAFEGRKVGVEITELYIERVLGQPLLQVQESVSERVLDHARRIYDSSAGRPLYVRVLFNSAYGLGSLQRNRTAENLAQLVRNMGVGLGKDVEWRPDDHRHPLANVVTFVRALGVPSPEMSHWTAVRAGWAAPLTASTLQSRIDGKAVRLGTYQQSLPENWLVIAADGRKPSQLFMRNDELDVSALRSPFDRTFFYGFPERAVIELTPSNVQAAGG